MKLSAITGTQEPEATDPPSGHTQMTSLVDNLERYVTGRFATTAARDAAIPAPTLGMLCFVTGSGLLMWRPTGGSGGTPGWYPLPGKIVRTNSGSLININTSAGGAYDLASVDQGITYPFHTQTFVTVSGFGGFGGGPVQFNYDIYGFSANTVMLQSQSPLWAQTGNHTAVALATMWNNSPGTSVGFKIRTTYITGTNIHTGGSYIYQIIATPEPGY